MLNLSSLSTQSLASCVNYFVWNCLTCFSNTKIGSVTSFSILFNFQGPVSASAKRLTTLLFYHRSDFLSSSFSKFFVSYRTWSVLSFSALTGTFRRLLVLFALLPAGTQKSFFCLSAWRSSIIPYTGPLCKPFYIFSPFFALCIHQPVFRSVSGDVLTFLPPFLRKTAAAQKCSGCCLGIQFFSSCFISRRVSQTAAANIGSAAIRPMGMGPSTL